MGGGLALFSVKELVHMPFLRSYKRREIERPGSLVISMLLVVTHYLWSIFDDSGLFVSSVLSSAVPLFSFHMLAGNLDHAPCRMRLLLPMMLAKS